MKTKILIILALTLLTSTALSAFSSIYSDHKSFTVGDVLTVIITESSSAKSGATSQTDRSFNHGFNTEAGRGPLTYPIIWHWYISWQFKQRRCKYLTRRLIKSKYDCQNHRY